MRFMASSGDRKRCCAYKHNVDKLKLKSFSRKPIFFDRKKAHLALRRALYQNVTFFGGGGGVRLQLTSNAG